MTQRADRRPPASTSPRVAPYQRPAAVPRAWLLRTTALLPVALASFTAQAQLPTGGQVVAGQAAIAQTGTQTTITQGTDRAAINWQGFNVGAGNTVQFQQPSAGSWTLNRVVGPDPSVIAGRITANGGVALVNQSGIVFARGAQVDVGSLIATAPGITNENFMAGQMRFDQAARPGAQVRNEGRITVMDRGIAVLAGPRVSNTGEIRARLGRVVLAGAEAFTLDLAGDGLISIDITGAVQGGGAAVVTNEGLIEANGGSVLLTAAAAGDLVEGLVRNTGTIRANTEAGQAGQVALRSSGGGVEVTGRVEATGAAGQRGGSIAVQSDRSVRIASGATLDASGGAGGGTVLVGTTGVGRNQTMARSTTVERGATIRADATVLGQGGTIAINSTEASLVEGALSARGGPQGGNGGFIEISGQAVLNIAASVDTRAPAGLAGTLLIDPDAILIRNNGAPANQIPASTDTTITATSGNGTTELRASELSASMGNITLQASTTITTSAAVTKGTGTLTLIAGTDVSVGASLDVTAGITIQAGGAVTQTAAITTGSLTIRGVTGGTTSAGSVSLNETGNAIGTLDARTTGALSAVSGGGTFTIAQAASSTSGSVSITGNAGTSLNVTGAVSGTAAVTLTGNSIALGANVTGGSGAVVALQLRSGGLLSGAGVVSAAGASTVRVGEAGSGGAILSINTGGTPGLVTLSATTLNNVSAGTLVLGVNAAGTTTAAAVIINTALNPTGNTGLDIRGTGAMTINADLTGGTGGVSLNAGDTLAQNSGTISAAGGTASLTATGQVGVQGAGVSAGTVIVTSTTADIDLAGGSINAGAGVVSLRAGGAVFQSAVSAAITAGTLNVTGAGGPGTAAASIDLSGNGGGNAITAIGEMRASGPASLFTTTALSIGTVNTGGSTFAIQSSGAVTIAAGTINAASGTITAGTSITQANGSTVTVSGSLALNADGAISQSATSTISAGSVTVRGTAGTGNALSLNLGQTGNSLGTLDALTSGALSVASGGTTLTINRAISSTSGAVSLLGNSGTSLVVDAAGGGVSGTANVTLRGNSITVANTVTGGTGAGVVVALELRDGGRLSGTGAISTTGGTVRLGAAAAGSDLRINNSGTGGQVSLAQATVQAVSAGQLVLGVNAADTTTAGAVAIATALNTAGTGLAIRGTGAVTLSANLTSTAGITVTGGSTVTQSSSTISGGAFATLAGTGNVSTSGTISGDTITLTSVTGNVTQANGSLQTTGGSETVALNAAGTVSQTGGTITAGSVVVRGATGGSSDAGSIALTSGGNDIGLFDLRASGTLAVVANSSSNVVTIRQARGTTVSVVANSSNALTIDAAGSGVTATAATGGNVTLRGDSIAVGAAVAGGVDATALVTLELRDGGLLSGAGAITTGGTIRIGATAATDLRIADTAQGNTISLSATTLAAIQAQNLTIGVNAAGTRTADAATIAASITPAISGTLTIRANTLTQSAGTISVGAGGGAVALTTQNGLSLGGTVSGTGITLTSVNAGVTQTAGTIAAGTGALAITADGSVSLAGAASGTGITITATTGGISQSAGSVNAGTGALVLRANNTIAQSGGTMAGASLTVGGETGNNSSSNTITLNQAGNSFAAITSARSTGNITIRSDAAALSVGLISGDNITIRGGNAAGTAITLAGTVTTNGNNRNVVLRTDGSIAQNTGAVVTTDTLTIGGQTVTNAASASLTEANAVSSVTANVTGALAFTTTQAFSTNGNTINAGSLALTASSITVANNDVLTVTSGDLILVGTATSGTAINIVGTLTGVSGQRLVLRADTLDISGTITANGLNGLAAIEVGPRTASRSMVVGGSVGGALSLDTGTRTVLVNAAPGRLQFGETVIGASTVRGTNVTIASGGGGAQTLAATTRLVVATDGDIAIDAPLTVLGTGVGSVELRAAGTITGLGTIITGSGGLSIRGADGTTNSSAGQVNLTQTGNEIQRLDARSTASLFVANRSADLIIRQARGTSVAIDADTRIATVEAAGTGGLGITATSGNAGLRAGTIILDSGITAGSGQTVTVQIAGTGTLSGAGVLSASGGTVEIGASSAAALTIGGLGIPVSVLNNAVATTTQVGRSTFNGGTTVTASTTTVSGSVTRTGNGTLSIIGGAIVLGGDISAGSLAITSTSGALTLGTTSLTASTPSTGRVTLDAATSISQTGGGISAPQFAAIARSGGISLTAGTNAITSIVGGVTAPTNANGFADATRGLFATGTIGLSVTGALVLSTGVESRGGSVSLSGTSITQNGSTRLFATTSATLTATGASGLSVQGALASDTITLQSAGAVTKGGSGSFSGSTVAATALTVLDAAGTAGSSAGGAVQITGGGNAISALDAGATGALSVISTAAMTVTRATGSTVTLTGASLDLQGAVNAGTGTVGLTGSSGGITQTSAALITAGTLNVSAAGNVVLDSGDAARATPTLWNQVGTLGSVSVSGSGNGFTFYTSNNLTLAGTSNIAGAALMVTNGTLGQTSGSLTAASLGLAANGTVTLAGTISTGSGQTTITSATGAITQTGGSITAGDFAARGTALDFSAVTNALSGTLALNASTGALSIDLSGNVTLGSINAATFAGSVAVSGLSAGGAITISAGGLSSVSGPIPISAGGLLVLRTDALSLGVDVTVSATGISVGPRTAGQAVQIGSADTGSTLGFDATTLGRLTAAGVPLTIGETVIGAITVTGGAITLGAALTATNSVTLIGTGAGTVNAAASLSSGTFTLVSGGNISLPGSITARTIRLSASGSVIQPDNASGVGGTYAGTTFLNTTSVFGLAVRAGSGDIDLRALGNTVTGLAAASVTGSANVVGGAAMSVNLISTNFLLPGGTTTSVAGVTAAQDVFLQTGSLFNGFGIAAGNGRIITLRADAMDLTGAVTATGGTVNLATLNLSRPITLGAEVASTLSLTQAELNLVTASGLVIGRFSGAQASAITIDAAGIAVPGTVGALRLIGSSLTLAGDLTATGKAVEARISGLTSSGGGIIGASSFNLRGLDGTGAGGAVNVGGTNQITTLDINSTGAVSLALNAGGGTIAATQLRGTSVDVTVTNGNFAVNGVSASTSTAFSITGATVLTTSAAITAADGLTLSAGTLTLGAPATVTAGLATLTSTTGALTLNAALTTSNGGATLSSGLATQVNAAVSVTGGDASFSGAGFTSVAAGTITVAGGDLTISNTGVVTIGGALETTTGSISITGATTLNINATIDAANGLTLSAGSLDIQNAITLTQGLLGLNATVGDLSINASLTTQNGGATLGAAGTIFVNAPVSVTGGALNISGGNFTSVVAGTLSVLAPGTNPINITNTGAVTIGGTVNDATGSVSITGATTLDTTATITGQTGVTLSARTVTLGAGVTATMGNASVTGTTGTVTANAAVSATAGTVTLDAAGALVLNGAITSAAGNTVTLRAGAAAGTAVDSITQTAAGIIGGASGGTTNLVVVGRSLDAPVTLTRNNRLATVDAQARGVLSLTTTGALGVTRATSAGSIAATSAVSLSAASLNLTGAVGATTTGTVTLTALSGDITQTAAGIITAGTLAGGASGDVTLNTANNLVSRTGVFSPLGGDFSLLSTAALTIGSPLNAPGKAIVLTGASLAVEGALTAATVTLGATGGGITQTNAGIITTPSLVATASAGVALDAGDAAATQTAAWNQVTTLASGSGGTGGFTLRNSRDLSVTGTVSAGSGQVLRLDVTGTPVLQATSALSAPLGTIAIASSGMIDLRGTLSAGLSTLTSTTGLVVQTTGSITGGLAVQANGNIDVQNPANAITNFSANAIAGTVNVVATTPMTVTTATNVALHGGTTVTIAGVSGATVQLTAPDLTLNAAVTATTGFVQLRADTMAIATTAAINATGDQVRIEQLTLGITPRGISLGAENAGSLSLTTTELAAITTPTLIFGRSTGAGATAVAGQITLSGGITVPSSVTGALRLIGSGIAVDGTLNATGTAVTELRALTQNITSTTGGVSGQALIATAPFGSVTLSASNDFTSVTGSASLGGSFTYRDATGFAVAAPGITAATVSLTADTGNITQAAGAPIVAGSLFALARTGSALIDGGSAASTGADLNQITTLLGGGAGAGGVFRLRNATGFNINGVLDNGAGGALGTAQFFAPTGGITQSGGVIRANRLEVTLPAGSASFGLGNAIGSLGTSSIAGDLTLTNNASLALAGPVDIGSAAGGPASMTTITLNGGSLTQGTGAPLRTDSLVISASGGDVRLNAGGSSSPNDLSQVGTLAGVTAGGVVDIRLGAPTLVAGLLRAGSAAGTPTGALSLEAPGITIGLPGQVGTLIRAGSVVLRTQAGFDGPAIPGSGNITQPGGAVEANNLSISAPSGNIQMDRSANRFTTLAAGTSANGAVSSRSLVAGGTIDLTEGGSGFTVQSGITSNGLTRLSASNALALNVPVALSGPISLSAGGLLTITGGGALSAGGTVNLFGGSGIAIQGNVFGPIVNVAAGGTFTLNGGSVSASLSPPGAIDVSAGALVTTGGIFSAHTVILRIGGGAQIDNTSFNATDVVNVTSGGSMNVNGVLVNANAAQFRSSGFLALNGGSYTLGRVAVFAGVAGISTATPTIVRPRSGGTYPGIVYDTRQGFGAIDPLIIVQADIAGLPVNSQPTQVRTPNADLPGDFGPSSNAPAGNAQIRLDALQSPVFILIDGGNFTANFNTAGRVGVHGRGGSSTATGVLVDPSGRRFEGQSTASLADATRPATGSELSRFRLNDCVISSFNCVAPTQVLVVPVTVPSIPPLAFGLGGRDPDAVSPNVAEEWSTREDE